MKSCQPYLNYLLYFFYLFRKILLIFTDTYSRKTKNLLENEKCWYGKDFLQQLLYVIYQEFYKSMECIFEKIVKIISLTMFSGLLNNDLGFNVAIALKGMYRSSRSASDL